MTHTSTEQPEAKASVSNVSLAAPVKLPDPVAWRYMPSEVWKQLEITQDKEREKLARSFGLEVEPLYTEKQVIDLLNLNYKRKI